MIAGVGTDILHIKRIDDAYRRTGGKLALRILGPQELVEFYQRKIHSDARAITYLASRFAAKEAFSKALGTGMTGPMKFKALDIVNDSAGKPIANYGTILSDYMDTREFSSHISISHEGDIVVAFVVISKS